MVRTHHGSPLNYLKLNDLILVSFVATRVFATFALHASFVAHLGKAVVFRNKTRTCTNRLGTCGYV